MAAGGDLGTFARHARRMVTAEHHADCRAVFRPRVGRPETRHPDPACTGCVTDEHRALWRVLAGEAEERLRSVEASTLWP